MQADSAGDRVRKLLSAILGDHRVEAHGFVRSQQPAWDSLKHLEIVFAIEDEFGIRFSEGEIGALDSLTSILKALENHLAS